jgi:hypothetical protein
MMARSLMPHQKQFLSGGRMFLDCRCFIEEWLSGLLAMDPQLLYGRTYG